MKWIRILENGINRKVDNYPILKQGLIILNNIGVEEVDEKYVKRIELLIQETRNILNSNSKAEVLIERYDYVLDIDYTVIDLRYSR